MYYFSSSPPPSKKIRLCPIEEDYNGYKDVGWWLGCIHNIGPRFDDWSSLVEFVRIEILTHSYKWILDKNSQRLNCEWAIVTDIKKEIGFYQM